MVHTLNPSTQETKAGRCVWVWHQPGLNSIDFHIPDQSGIHSKTLSKNKAQEWQCITVIPAIMRLRQKTTKLRPVWNYIVKPQPQRTKQGLKRLNLGMKSTSCIINDNQSSNPSTNITKPVLQQSVTPAPKDLIHILLISPGAFSYTNIPIKIKSLKNPI